MEKPDFFTWIETTYATRDEVPERLRLEMRVLAHYGATPEELATIFNMPVDWVACFVDEKPAPLN